MALIFFLKNGFGSDKIAENKGLTYDSDYILNGATIQDLVNKDTDGDGVFDWQEALLGADLAANTGASSDSSFGNQENLTETEKFSREFFSTVTALTQNGVMDQSTINQLGVALAERIQNSTQRKIFLLSDIKIAVKDNLEALQIYGETLVSIQKKYQLNYTVMDVLQKFIIDENNIDASVLSELDPIIEKTSKLIDALVKMTVPQSLATSHLSVINTLESLVENISDIKLYETDVIISLSGISQYEQNTTTLESNINTLENTIWQKLNNKGKIAQ